MPLVPPKKKEPSGRGQAYTIDQVRALAATVSLATAGKAGWGLGRNASYDLNAAGEFPCEVLKIGARFKVRKSAILTALGYDADGKLLPAVAPAVGSQQGAA